MKKTIVLLLSLILLFSFVSCNGSTKSPSDSGSSNKPTITVPTAPVDTNAPKSESQLESYNQEEDLPKIQAIISTLSTNEEYGSLTMDLDATTSYSIKNDADIEGKKLTGSFSLREIDVRNSKEYVSKNIFNGSITIDGIEYSFNNFCIEKTKEGTTTYSGTISKAGNPLDTSNLSTEETRLYSFINFGYHNCSIPKSVTVSRTGAYVKYDSENIKGDYSIIYSVSNNSLVADTIVNFSKIVGSDSNTYTFTTKYKVVQSFTSNVPSISIEYISINGKYFKPSDFTSNHNLLEFLVYFYQIS